MTACRFAGCGEAAIKQRRVVMNLEGAAVDVWIDACTDHDRALMAGMLEGLTIDGHATRDDGGE